MQTESVVRNLLLTELGIYGEYSNIVIETGRFSVMKRVKSKHEEDWNVEVRWGTLRKILENRSFNNNEIRLR